MLRSIVVPKKMNPMGKLPCSPKMPSKEGTTPAPNRIEIGIIIETITFVKCFDPILDRAANPAGKKQPTITGCRKITSNKLAPDVRPSKAVKIPEPITITHPHSLS